MIIGLSAKAQSGKSVFQKVAIEEFGAIPLSFAKVLKQEVAEFLDDNDVCWEERHLYGNNDDKQEFLKISPSAFGTGSSFFKLSKLEHGACIFTPRALMQWFGTEYRRSQDPGYWVKRTLDNLNHKYIYVVDDVRFKNEAQGILDRGGKLIRIVRPNAPQISNPTHPSEIDLDDWNNWYTVILNDGTLNDYHKLARKTMERIINE